ncbi:hypothetical protein RclHR1_22700004 [Rhizophagus clarus]|uniref:Uncharacterized protein n=1 Tax=Rhizophagus clarus TaxID=94130 RepID=A0A2Z6QWS6_9GLOM|nr:hypothetical protein RclHR1_22700004 [Rhizophagus clarus]GES94884.1 hypothetical protein RCL_jg19106.t1 [Rhizophagus clarus]
MGPACLSDILQHGMRFLTGSSTNSSRRTLTYHDAITSCPSTAYPNPAILFRRRTSPLMISQTPRSRVVTGSNKVPFRPCRCHNFKSKNDELLTKPASSQNYDTGSCMSNSK